jgi:speckle-type POZ protein
VSKDDLAASGRLKDDCLAIKCTVGVSKLAGTHVEDDGIVVPPSNITKDLGNLLENGLRADLTVKIGWFKSFKVHACVLAARSPVFHAQLCGSMMESRARSIRIKHMDAKVFEVFLHYIYNDCLPEFMEETTEETMNMTQHLLVVADRYAMERLKLICEAKLSKALEVHTVGFTLDLAEQYHCQQLKDFCLKYIVRDNERLREIVKTKGFEQLKQNKPGVAYDILEKVIGNL